MSAYTFTALSTAGPTDAHGRATKTPIGLVNNGVHINPNGANQPTIFSSETAQVFVLPSRGGGTSYPPQPQHQATRQNGLQRTNGFAEPSSSQRLFGASETHFASDTSAEELSRLQIVTMRQLQRALQNKITQSTRNPMDVWTAFNKLDRRKKNALNLADLIAAVRGFNLVATEELCAQLLQALDRDHDGVLSLTEFVNAFSDNNHGSSSVQIQEPSAHVESSRKRYGRSLKFHHPLHNAIAAYNNEFSGSDSHF